MKSSLDTTGSGLRLIGAESLNSWKLVVCRRAIAAAEGVADGLGVGAGVGAGAATRGFRDGVAATGLTEGVGLAEGVGFAEGVRS